MSARERRDVGARLILPVLSIANVAGSSSSSSRERDEEGGMERREEREGEGEVKIAHPFVYNGTCGARTRSAHTHTDTKIQSCVFMCACMHFPACVCVRARA